LQRAVAPGTGGTPALHFAAHVDGSCTLFTTVTAEPLLSAPGQAFVLLYWYHMAAREAVAAAATMNIPLGPSLGGRDVAVRSAILFKNNNNYYSFHKMTEFSTKYNAI
tara:strand:+ start:2211 stop:2534 length:324 start_codon:yes stop_codon:yes gene_type:complete